MLRRIIIIMRRIRPKGARTDGVLLAACKRHSQDLDDQPQHAESRLNYTSLQKYEIRI